MLINRAHLSGCPVGVSTVPTLRGLLWGHCAVHSPTLDESIVSHYQVFEDMCQVEAYERP